jgi:regulator of cell morphogenesis and NO signaling
VICLIKVLSAHGERHLELKALKTAFTHLREDLKPHLLKGAKNFIFLIRSLESQELNTNIKAVSKSINVMLMERDRLGSLLKEIKELTKG